MGDIVANLAIEAIVEGSAVVMMNSNLINPELDEEEYANAAPTIGYLMAAHFSTPEKHNVELYQTDGLFFSIHHKRRMYLRPALRGEFDTYISEEDYEQRPILWVLVSQLAPGIHERTPRWRGKAFWNGKDVASDEGTAGIVMRMSEKGGVSQSEWLSFIYDQRARKGKTSTKKSMVN